MRVGIRLGLTFGVIVLLLLGTVGFTIAQVDRVTDMSTRMNTRIMPRILTAQEIVEDYLNQSAGIRGYVLTGDESYVEDYQAGLSAARVDLDTLRSMIDTPRGAQLFEDLQTLSLRYEQQIDEIIDLVRAGDREAASGKLLHDMQSQRIELETRTAEFVDYQKQSFSDEQQEVESTRESVWALTLLSGGIAVILTLLFAYTTTISITRPVRRLAHAAAALGRDDFGPALALSDVGASEHGDPEPGGARDELVSLAGVFGSMAALVQRRQGSLADHAELADALAGSLDLERLANAAAALMAKALRCEVVAIYLCEESGALVRTGAHAVGRAEPVVYRPGEGLPGQAAAARQRIVVSQIPSDTPYTVDDGVGIAVPRTLVAAPLLSGSDLIGSMVLASLREMDEEALAFVDVAAQQMGVALSNARTHQRVNRLADELRERNEELAAQNEEIKAQSEELQAQSEELQSQSEEIQSQLEELQAQADEIVAQSQEIERSNQDLRRWNEQLERSRREIALRAATIEELQRISQAVALSLSLRETLDAIVAAAGDLIGSSLSAVFLLEPDGYHFTVAAWHGLDDNPTRGQPLRMDNTVAGQAILARETRCVSDLTESGSSVVVPRLAEGRAARALIVAPMIAKGEVIGVLEVYFAEPHDCPPEETEFLSSLAHSAGVAVLNARLHERLLDQYAQLQTSSARALEAAELKAQFLSGMSHELRTPLHSILALSEMLLQRMDGDLTSEQARQVEIIQRNGQMLLNLINEVLDLSRIEAGRVEIHVTRFDLATSIRRLDQMVRPLAVAKGLALDLNIDAQMGEFCSDEQKLQQILLNLLSNAVKFTERGEITVRARRVDSNTAADSDEGPLPGAGSRPASSPWGIRVEVTDTGIGLADGDRETIFQAFRQIEAGASRSHAGTGLGLTIARNLARLLGGDIELHSALGNGSTFVLSLPCLAESEATGPADPSGRPTIGLLGDA